jgi:hypothetical protein
MARPTRAAGDIEHAGPDFSIYGGVAREEVHLGAAGPGLVRERPGGGAANLNERRGARRLLAEPARMAYVRVIQATVRARTTARTGQRTQEGLWLQVDAAYGST